MSAPAARRLAATAALVLPALAACASERPAAVDPDVRLARSMAATVPSGAVYTMTDAAAGNAVLAFRRAADGSLTALGASRTGGAGSGITAVDPLASQHALRLSPDRRFLFVVNAGSDDVSSFGVAADGALTLLDREASGGDMPVSLAAHDRLLYVLNARDGTLHGLMVGGSGKLNPVPHSDVDLDLAAGQGTGVTFTPNGRQLVIAYKGGLDASDPGGLLVFPVLANGRLGAPTRTAALHRFAFGVDATDDHVLVAETAGFVTSYRIGQRGLTAVSSPSTAGLDVCWVVITRDGRRVYASNTGSATIAGFALDAGGRLTPTGRGAIVGALPTGVAPLDLATSDDGRFLYVLEGATGAIAGFGVDRDGALAAPVRVPTGGTARQGLAAF
jgi:6-phosphogluconolactonase